MIQSTEVKKKKANLQVTSFVDILPVDLRFILLLGVESEHLSIGKMKEAHLFPQMIVTGHVVIVRIGLTKMKDVCVIWEGGDDVPLTILRKRTECKFSIFFSLKYKQLVTNVVFCYI